MLSKHLEYSKHRQSFLFGEMITLSIFNQYVYIYIGIVYALRIIAMKHNITIEVVLSQMQSTPIHFQSANCDSTSWMASFYLLLTVLCSLCHKDAIVTLLSDQMTFQMINLTFCAFFLHRRIFLFNNITNHMYILIISKLI